jgi:hypothetical protein
MHEFRIRQDGFKDIKKKLVLTLSIMFTAIFLIIIVLPALMSNDPERFQTLPYLVPIFLGVFIFSLFIGIKKQRSLFESFTLRIDDEKIVRERLNTPTLTIYRNDITEIIKHANGSFVIRGKSKLNPIVMPAQVVDYQLLESMLNQIKTIKVLTTKTFLEKMFIPISLSGAILMGITFISKNETVTLISSILIVILLLASLFLIQQSKNIDKRTKRISWVTLIPLAAFASMIISKLSE